MPAYNQTEDQLNNRVLLDQAVATYLANPVQQILDVQRLLAENLRNLGKPASVFSSGTAWQSVGSYTMPNDSSPELNKWKTMTNSVVPTVWVFPLEGAEIFRASFQVFTTATPGSPNFAAFALTTNEPPLNPIQAKNFAFFRKGNGVGGVSNSEFWSSIYDDIPCSGYKYIHIFWWSFNVVSFADLILLSRGNTVALGTNMNYTLIK